MLEHLEEGEGRDVDSLGRISYSGIWVRRSIATHTTPTLEVLKHLRVHGKGLCVY